MASVATFVYYLNHCNTHTQTYTEAAYTYLGLLKLIDLRRKLYPSSVAISYISTHDHMKVNIAREYYGNNKF